MSARYLLAAVALGVFIAFPAHAIKRRSVFPGPGPAVGQCHAFGLVTAGTVASYRTSDPGGATMATFTITWLSDTPTQTKTTQRTVTAQGTADAETTADGEIIGTLRALKHLYTKGSTTVPVIGKVTSEVDIDFVPSLAAGPADGWCVGKTWNVAPTTETIVTRTPLGQNTIIQTTQASEGEVLAVGESLSVPGGTFDTVRYRGALVSGNNVQTAITWVSMERNIVVRQDTIDGAGNVTTTTVLTDVQ